MNHAHSNNQEKEFDSNYSEFIDWCNDDDHDANDSIDDTFEDDDEEYDDEEDFDCEQSIYAKPIVVGYAFGPKKMSTMGVVMAEASKAKLSTTKTVSKIDDDSFPIVSELEDHTNGFITRPSETLRNTVNSSNEEYRDHRLTTMAPVFTTGLTKDILSSHEIQQQRNFQITNGTASEIHVSESTSTAKNDSRTEGSDCSVRHNQQQKNQNMLDCHQRITFTIDGHMVNPVDDGTGDSINTKSNLKNIVRYLRLSCSSVDSSTASGTCTASVGSSSQRTTGTTAALTCSSVASPPVLKRCSKQQNNTSATLKSERIPVRISFVPLDPGM